jgi:hypothetical protein
MSTLHPISYKVGCNFDLELLDQLHELNVRYSLDQPWQITELYGSLPSVNPIGTARPSFRLKDDNEEFLAAFVAKALSYGFGMNYTINTSAVDPRELKAHEATIVKFLEFLKSIGVIRVTVAHPLVAQIVNDLCPTLPIELSTILQLRHPRQLEQLKRRCPSIEKICLDVFANRDGEKLAQFMMLSRSLGITLETIVNEFCVYECADRNQCYDLHALNLSKDEVKMYGHYPMGNCIRERVLKPIEWLWARFILPQWVRRYHMTFGISSFKITGRTHPTAYIARVTEAYMRGEYTGNLVELWADVENIGRLAAEYHQPRVLIDSGKLPANFLDFYFGGVVPTYQSEQAFMIRMHQLCTT